MAHYYRDHDAEEAEMNELRAQSRAQRNYERKLAEFPDCRDPDHPGCINCFEEEDTDD